jgi:hypothetical protein
MRLAAVVLAVAAALAGCDDDTTAAAADQSVASASDLGVADDASVDLATLPCGEPFMRCCDGKTPACNPATSTCNMYGVCVSCGLYPLACCPGNSCQSDQTCLSDPTSGSFCYPCGHQGQPCCFEGPACVQPGTSCVMPDASTPICST